jgi:hypothetical protein
VTRLTSNRQPRIRQYTSFAATFLLAITLATIGSAAPQPVLPHDYSFHVDFATESYEDALLRVRNNLLAALKTADTFPAGYPKVCRFRFEPRQGLEAASGVRPYGSEMGDPGAQGILLDAEGHYVMLGVLDYPDLRPSLFDIFLVGDPAVAELNQAARETTPRIVVQVPVLGDAQYPALAELLAKGIRGAGAQEVSFK